MKKIDLKSKVILLTKFSWTCFLLLSYIIFSIGFWLIGKLILPNLYYLFICIGLTLFICSIFLLRILLRKYDNNKLNKLKNTGANIDSQIPSINGIRKDEDNIKKFNFLENPLLKKITIGCTLTFIIAFTIVMFAMGATIKKQSKEIWINDVCYFLNEEMYYEVSRCNDSNQIVIEDEINEIPVKKITIDAFDACSSLTSITIPSNITKIDDSAFDKCLSLKNVYYYGINPFNNSIDISVNDSPLQEATWYYYYNENKSNYTVGNWWYFDIDGKTIIAYSNYDMTNINFNDVSYIYDGQTKNISLTGELPNGVSVKYYCNNKEFNGAIDAGVYDVTAKFTSSNDIYKAPKDMKASLTIEKGTYNLSNINFNDVSYIYDGQTKNISLTGELPNGVSVKYYCNNDEFNGAVDAGVYDVTAKFTSSNNNYESIDEMKASLTIEKATYDLSNINFNDVSYIYDGQTKNISLTGELPNGVSVKYYCNNDEFNGAVDAGVYDVTARFTSSNKNYESIDEMKASLTIEKGTCDLSNINFNDVSYIYDGQTKNISITGELPNGVSVKYYCNNEEFNGAVDAGVYDVTAEFIINENNYNTPLTRTLSAKINIYDSSAFTLINDSKTATLKHAPNSTSLDIPNYIYFNDQLYEINSIGDEAFYNCSSLTSITIPNSVTSIGARAFARCSNLTSVIFEDDSQLTSIGDTAFYDCSSLTSITIPNSVTSIGDEAFYFCLSLTSITIPNSVISIGANAFDTCFDLTSIIFEDDSQLTSISDYAFSKCTSLTSITIPNSVTSIGHAAFSSCSSLTSITIPNSVTSIDDYAFSGCSMTSITIPNSVTSIGHNAFSSCSSLTSITIPNSVTSIGDYTFQYCSSLTSISIPNSVTSIGDVAFRGCSSLTSITIPNSVTSIGDFAFKNCSSLTFIIIPNSVTSIGDYTFDSCSNLTDVYFQGTDMEWNTINTGSNNTYLTNANKHYYSETTPTDTTNSYWHYDTDGKTPILWTNEE